MTQIYQKDTLTVWKWKEPYENNLGLTVGMVKYKLEDSATRKCTYSFIITEETDAVEDAHTIDILIKGLHRMHYSRRDESPTRTVNIDMN